MREFTTADDCFELKELGMRPFAAVHYERKQLSTVFADRTLDDITGARDLRTQLRHLYAGAALAQRHGVPFTHRKVQWMLYAILNMNDDLCMYHEQYINSTLNWMPQGNTVVEFDDIATFVSNLDPELYKEVRHAVRTP